jgi:hypothetical protein
MKILMLTILLLAIGCKSEPVEEVKEEVKSEESSK